MKPIILGQIDQINTQLADMSTQKVDKVTGKGLSTNDYSDTEKAEVAKVVNKTDKSYVDTLVASQASGSPKGIYATLSALQTAYPSGNTNIYIVSADGKWYYWSGSAWTVGGTYQSTGIPFNSISEDKLTFVPIKGIKGKNLFNQNDITLDRYISYSTGIENGTNTTYCYSSYIPVEPNTNYTLEISEQLAWYDANKNFISGVNKSGTTPQTYTTPANTAYVRFNVQKANLSTTQFEKSNSATFYEAFGADKLNPLVQIADSNIPTNSISLTKLMNNENLAIGQPSKNLFNKVNIGADGTYVAWDTGIVQPGSLGYSPSDWIPITPNITYTINKHEQLAWYDANKTYISGASGMSSLVKTVTSPVNAYYLRVTLKTANKDTYQIEVGGSVTPYVDYGSFLISSYLDSKLFFKTLHSIFSQLRKNSGLKIKLIGDSITHGVGGTGFTQDGELIVTGYNVNTSGYCWANLLRDYLQSKFTCTVKNYGTTGRNSSFLLSNISTLVKSDDSIVICMIGTNDRNNEGSNSKQLFYDNLIAIGNYVKGMGKEIIFMSSIPTSISNETDGTKLFHMEDIDSIIMSVSSYFNQSYISLYKEFIKYCEYRNITIDSLLSDGVHPNDSGYLTMFNIVCDSLGIGRKRAGATW